LSLFSSGVENNNKKNQKTGEEAEETKEKTKHFAWKSLDSNGHKKEKKKEEQASSFIFSVLL